MDSRFGLVDPKCEALVAMHEDGTIARAYPHDSMIFESRACDSTLLEELVPRAWLGVLVDRSRIARTTLVPSTVELDCPAREGYAARSIRIRIAPGDGDVFLLFRDTSFDPRGELVRETIDDASFWALFEIAPIPLVVGIAHSETSIGPARMNRRFTEVFGYTSEDAPTVQHWWPLAYPDETYRDEIREEWFRRLRESGGDVSRIEPIEAKVRCKDGTVREIEFGASTISGHHVITFVDLTERNRARRELAERVEELEVALAQVKVLRGLLPLCAWCKKVRDDGGYWSRVEEFLARNTDWTVTHGICPDCQKKHFGVHGD